MCKSISCIILGVLNIAMLIGGLALLILGALMKWNKDMLRKICDHALQFIQEKLNQKVSEQANLAISRIQEFAGPFGLIVFIGGIVIVCVALLAFLGLCCHIKCFLILYACIVGAVFVAHGIVLIIYFSNRDLILNFAHKYLQEAVLKYKSMESGEFESALLTVLMPTVQCCGYDSANDFNAPDAAFTRTDKVGQMTFQNLSYPVPCCNLNMELGDTQEFCPHTFTSNNSFIDYGCKMKMEKEFFDKVAYGSIVVLLVTAAVFAMALVYLACPC